MSFAVCFDQVFRNPSDEMIFEGSLDDLMQEVER
jgi:hypothetical protein